MHRHERESYRTYNVHETLKFIVGAQIILREDLNHWIWTGVNKVMSVYPYYVFCWSSFPLDQNEGRKKFLSNHELCPIEWWDEKTETFNETLRGKRQKRKRISLNASRLRHENSNHVVACGTNLLYDILTVALLPRCCPKSKNFRLKIFFIRLVHAPLAFSETASQIAEGG